MNSSSRSATAPAASSAAARSSGWPFSTCAATRRMLMAKLLRSIGTGIARPRLAAVIVVADLDRGQPGAERAFDVEEAPSGQAVARRLDRGLVDRPPDRIGKGRQRAIEIVHQR